MLSMRCFSTDGSAECMRHGRTHAAATASPCLAARAQVERNLHDAMGVARNVMMDPRLVPGGGAVEMAVSRGLSDRAAAVVGPEQVRREQAPRCRVASCTDQNSATLLLPGQPGKKGHFPWWGHEGRQGVDAEQHQMSCEL